MYYAIRNGARVINASWGFYDTIKPQIMEPLLKEAAAKGVIIVASAGNDQRNTDEFLHWPSGFADKTAFPDYNVVSVAALGQTGNDLWSRTNFGPQSINIAAPGEQIVSTGLIAVSEVAGMTGTSAAAPFVTRAIAITLGMAAKKNPKDVATCAISNGTAVPLPAADAAKLSSGGKLSPTTAAACQ
jgi:subtilisin family serine protease